MQKCTIQIHKKDHIQEPATIEGIQWETSISGEPAKLTFTVIKDNVLAFREGDKVTFTYGKNLVFSGFVFEKTRDKNHHIQVTCFDSTFFLKNKENYAFTGVRADQIVKRIAEDMGLNVGHLTNTGYVIPKLAASDQSLFDTIQMALDETMYATKNQYILFDNFGLLELRYAGEMITDLLITYDTAENFDYTSTIADGTYNSVVVKDKDGKTVVLNNKPKQEQFGVLQLVLDNQNGGNALENAKAALASRAEPSRTFSVNGVFGDVRVRAGSSVYVYLYLGDHTCNQSLLVTRATHTFNNGHHSMELTLMDGGLYYATE